MLYEIDTSKKVDTVKTMIANTKGVFGCVAVKKDGTERTFCARTYEDSFARIEHGIIVVRELNDAKEDAGYRSINVDGVKQLTINGDTYTFSE